MKFPAVPPRFLVSSLDVTGTRSEIKTDISAMVDLIRQNTSLPCAVGDGIATPQQAAAMAKVSDGAIVGSAIIKPFAQYGPAAVPHIEAFVRDMAQAVHNA